MHSSKYQRSTTSDCKDIYRRETVRVCGKKLISFLLFLNCELFRYTQLKDEGEYHCQINTEPKMSLPIFLSVEGKGGPGGTIQHFTTPTFV